MNGWTKMENGREIAMTREEIFWACWKKDDMVMVRGELMLIDGFNPTHSEAVLIDENGKKRYAGVGLLRKVR